MLSSDVRTSLQPLLDHQVPGGPLLLNLWFFDCRVQCTLVAVSPSVLPPRQAVTTSSGTSASVFSKRLETGGLIRCYNWWSPSFLFILCPLYPVISGSLGFQGLIFGSSGTRLAPVGLPITAGVRSCGVQAPSLPFVRSGLLGSVVPYWVVSRPCRSFVPEASGTCSGSQSPNKPFCQPTLASLSRHGKRRRKRAPSLDDGSRHRL